MYLGLWLDSRWRLPTTPCFTLPVAVSLKRFLTPLFVLSLGIFVSCLSTITDGHGSPHWPGSPSDRKRRPIGDASAKRKQDRKNTSELQSLMRISYAVFCLKKTTHQAPPNHSK